MRGGGGGEDVQRGEQRVDEADFFVGDEGEGQGDEEGERRELVADCGGGGGSRGGLGGGGAGYGAVDVEEGEREVGGEEEGVALGEVVGPVVPAVEDGKGLGDVEVQEAEGGEDPLAVVESVEERRDGQDEGPDGSVCLGVQRVGFTHPQMAVSRMRTTRSVLVA